MKLKISENITFSNTSDIELFLSQIKKCDPLDASKYFDDQLKKLRESEEKIKTQIQSLTEASKQWK